ncbi:hypothetical protein RB653_000093 [Dictyostelium firmibasis]|uniref:Phosphoglycerate mutase family protein n=1 Tax=Dictyostelium firmibasis TaxID=79012 RepID=A0AAN7U6L4_9MYCE
MKSNKEFKEIFIIRHGESTFNEQYNELEDPYLFDARLTEFGEKQANQLSNNVRELLKDVELVITSPLTRALDTTKIGLLNLIKDKSIKCLVSPIHRELLTTSDDNGRIKSIIEKEYPEFDFSLINDERWWIPEIDDLFEIKSNLSIDINQYFKKSPFRESESLLLKRIEEFKKFLLTRSESIIAVVGHADFFYYLTQPQDLPMNNCQIIKFNLSLSDSKISNPIYLTDDNNQIIN